uniref:Uncharacterized protein n=1 Tax=Leptocylindrus danicus TaxID=163516 RepID=A0A7S2P013_9STRA|mmetsp:Transcript_18853/g.27956  ORF Transcript_18853/g.27956 Transcript_18853/m.27956 type:complete len:103 (+) Transcript_18853:3-311(+)
MLQHVIGYEKEDLDKAEQEVKRVKQNRRRTVNRARHFHKFDEMLESAQRKLKKALKKGPERTARESEPRRKSDGQMNRMNHHNLPSPDRISAPPKIWGALSY